MTNPDTRRIQQAQETIDRGERIANAMKLLPEYVELGIPKELLEPLVLQLQADASEAKQRSEFATARRAERVVDRMNEALDTWEDDEETCIARIRKNDPAFFAADSDGFVRQEVQRMSDEDMRYFKEKYEEVGRRVAAYAPAEDVKLLRVAFAYKDMVRIREGR
jgi:hypothetical protein